MKVIAEFDEKTIGVLCNPSEVEPLMKALRELYGIIWVEACYDPVSPQWEAFARKLLPYIKAANDILKFKT